MKIIKDQAIVEDSCTHLADDDALPPAGTVTVTLGRWKDDREALLNRTDPVGVRIVGDDDVRELHGDLDALPLIALEFPKFADGRGYSHAHILRAHMRFAGELRAIGDVLRDQIWNMSRVGINAFEVAADRSVEDALKAFTLYSVRYQSTVDQPLPIFRQ
jgi:uncharacterized protein (DUF934 family)